ncbi:MAG: hypothetical protein RBS37_05710 [Bacteroidales bacterium]|jgi:predicted flap endonuclease-1-like 5' DNA nuclease|nr:hypothetical protein [Bacteroidales bacterium]
MAERFTSDLLFIVFVLLIAALIGFLIGYYLRKSMKCRKCIEWEEENNSLKDTVRKLEADNSSLKEKNSKLAEESASLRGMVAKLESDLKAALTGRTTKKKGTKIVTDDLKIILGIGPKISGILKKRGIASWKQLSETPPSTISEILLADGGERYRIHKTETWPHQAKLASEGKWDDLKAYQDTIET